MAINKASMVLLMLFVVATISDAARFDSSLQLNKHSESEYQNFWDCECHEESGVKKCLRLATKVDDCPDTCSEPCICSGSTPRVCFCKYEVDSCPRAAWDLGFKDFVIRGHVKP